MLEARLNAESPQWGELPVELWATVFELGVVRSGRQLALPDLKRMIQVSAVCQAFRNGMRLALSGPCMLDLEEVRQEGMSMDSKLLLSWADASQWTVELDEYGCSIPGVVSWMHAAEQLEVLIARTSSLLAAAQLDHMLDQCSPRELQCKFGYVPTTFPPKLQQLTIQLEYWTEMERGGSSFEQAVGGLLYRLRNSSLDTLELSLGEHSVVAAPVCMPHMDTLALEFTLVDHKSVDLSWLQVQPVDHLCLTITVRSQDAGQQLRLIRQLQLLSIQWLSLELEGAVSEQLQQQWARFELVNEMVLYLPPSEMHISELPRSKCMYIYGCTKKANLQTVSISWSAICSSRSKTSISPGHHAQVIHIFGCPGHIPDRAHPWECEIDKPEAFCGLPDSIRSQEADKYGRYRLQNAAALRQSAAAGS